MFGNFMNQLKPLRPRETDDEDSSVSSSLTKLPSNLNLSSVSLNSIKSQTEKVSTQVFTSLKSQSNRVSKLLWSEDSDPSKSTASSSTCEARVRPLTILEQLNWPVLNYHKSWLSRSNSSNGDEEDIVEKFIRVIQSEDYDERPEETFYNHPQRRRNDREEIRRRLAMGADDDQGMERPHRKPSLHSRLQSGMNLQICFMNETASDCESQCSDTESTQDREVETDRVSSSSGNSKASTPQPIRTRTAHSEPDVRDAPVDFFTRQAQLQAEARMALAQAKEMARMQMEIEKQTKKKSPIAEIVRESFNKIGVPFPDSKRRISRQILTDMNVAQLQVIVNDLHTQIESLNEDLVTFLMERDDLHMEQDSMLVDIEDLTKHIGAKELSLRGPLDGKDTPKITPLTTLPSRSRSNSSRLKSIVKK